MKTLKKVLKSMAGDIVDVLFIVFFFFAFVILIKIGCSFVDKEIITSCKF